MKDGKVISRKGRLTDMETDQLQRYYGQAICKNLPDVKRMKRAIWATYFYSLSTNENPQHNLCPMANDGWCKFYKAKEDETIYNSGSQSVVRRPLGVCDNVSQLSLIHI